MVNNDFRAESLMHDINSNEPVGKFFKIFYINLKSYPAIQRCFITIACDDPNEAEHSFLDWFIDHDTSIDSLIITDIIDMGEYPE